MAVSEGWGCEDRDLYQRLEEIGVSHSLFPNHWLNSITHGDDYRSANYPLSKYVSMFINRNYLRIKQEMTDIQGGSLSTSVRTLIYQSVMHTVIRAQETHFIGKTLVEFTINKDQSQVDVLKFHLDTLPRPRRFLSRKIW